MRSINQYYFHLYFLMPQFYRDINPNKGNGFRSFLKALLMTLIMTLISLAINYVIAYMEGSTTSNSMDISSMWNIYNNYGVNPMSLSTYEKDIFANIVKSEDIHINFNDIGGNETLKDNIERLIIKPTLNPHIYSGRNLLKPPNGIILYGPPGTGKTMMARAVAKRIGGCFINVTSALIENKFYGESQKIVGAIFSIADKIKPCVIFFDEIDGLCGTRNILDQSHVTSVKTSLLSEMDGIHQRDPGVIVFGATNRIDNLDAALKRRMRLHIKVELPDKDSRREILEKVVNGEPLADDVDLDELADVADGMSGSDLTELCKLAAQYAIKENSNDSESILINKCHFDSAYCDLTEQ